MDVLNKRSPIKYTKEKNAANTRVRNIDAIVRFFGGKEKNSKRDKYRTGVRGTKRENLAYFMGMNTEFGNKYLSKIAQASITHRKGSLGDVMPFMP